MQRPPIRNLADLVTAGLVTPAEAAHLAPVVARYAFAITPAMADLIDTDDPADPIARQFVPDIRELVTTPDERADPIGDDVHSPVPGLVHRHRDRVLLKLTGVCPVYCRFCFRREMIGPEAGREMSVADIERAVADIAARPAITEVILTGGDPLVLSPRRVAMVTAMLSAVPHLTVLRWHTRVPVVAPDRVSDEMLAALTSSDRLIVYAAIHANHARELTPAACAALKRLRMAGLVLISQSVLLKGVNADLASLTGLMQAFVANGVKPYYLHHPDLAPGTSHMRVSIAEGQTLVAALRGAVSGLAQPTYVLDIPGGVAKVAIGASSVGVNNGVTTIRDSAGHVHPYPAEVAHD